MHSQRFIQSNLTILVRFCQEVFSWRKRRRGHGTAGGARV